MGALSLRGVGVLMGAVGTLVLIFVMSGSTFTVPDGEVGVITAAPLSNPPEGQQGLSQADANLKEHHEEAPATQPLRASRIEGTNGNFGLVRGRQSMQELRADPSMATRCRDTSPPLQGCTKGRSIRRHLKALGEMPPLYNTAIKGSTTAGIRIVNKRQAVEPMEHHAVFSLYRDAVYQGPFIPSRVMEFTGTHSAYDYDCPLDVDFRMYHPVRAVTCEWHDKEARRRGCSATVAKCTNTSDLVGAFPIVDEEYFENVVTLMTAYNAAKAGRHYVYVELGARYGTWAVRAGSAYRAHSPKDDFTVVALEAGCQWFRKMEEHVRCNDMEDNAALLLAYAAPRSYNKLRYNNPATYDQPHTVSVLDILPHFRHVDLIDFDIQGWEDMVIKEEGAVDMLTEKVGILHFGTHNVAVEGTVIRMLQPKGWCLLYYFAGSHHKKLDRSHVCTTPFGPAHFNDGALGMVNTKFYPELASSCPKYTKKVTAPTACYWIPEALTHLKPTFL